MSAHPPPPHALPQFHPMTVLRRWTQQGDEFRILDAVCGVACLGATGSGKTSGPARHLAIAYLAAEFGGIVLCAKPEERKQWQEWAELTERSHDLVIIDASNKNRFNFLDWESSQAGVGGGLTINVVAMLEEIISGLTPPDKQGGGDDGGFWEDALHQLLINTVELMQLARKPLDLSAMRDIVRSAPQSRRESEDPDWQARSICWKRLTEAEAATRDGDKEARPDYEECQAYWLEDFAALSEKTRSIIVLMFTKLAQPFTARPLRKIFSTDTTIRPEDTFRGKVIIVDLSCQEFRMAGRIAAIVLKFCWQMAVMRRPQPAPGTYLRPSFCWADEAAENFISRSDPAFQAVARSAAGCTVYLGQNINQYRRRLGSNDAFESFMGNLQTKFFCQNTGDTNEWAAKLLGQRWTEFQGSGSSYGASGGSASTSTSWQRAYLVEPNAFTTLRRGGAPNGYTVDTYVYKGGHIFYANGQSFLLLPIEQLG